jgi:hypothetical protein
MGVAALPSPVCVCCVRNVQCVQDTEVIPYLGLPVVLLVESIPKPASWYLVAILIELPRPTSIIVKTSKLTFKIFIFTA